MDCSLGTGDWGVEGEGGCGCGWGGSTGWESESERGRKTGRVGGKRAIDDSNDNVAAMIDCARISLATAHTHTLQYHARPGFSCRELAYHLDRLAGEAGPRTTTRAVYYMQPSPWNVLDDYRTYTALQVANTVSYRPTTNALRTFLIPTQKQRCSHHRIIILPSSLLLWSCLV